MSKRACLRIIASGSVGLAFFVLPVPWGGRLTVPFDIAVRWITEGAVVSHLCLWRARFDVSERLQDPRLEPGMLSTVSLLVGARL